VPALAVTEPESVVTYNFKFARPGRPGIMMIKPEPDSEAAAAAASDSETPYGLSSCEREPEH
jgi:hypothetical protein